MRIKMMIEFELDDSFGIAEDDLLWLENEVLVGDGNLILHSNDIGDTVGVIKLVRNIQYITANRKEEETIEDGFGSTWMKRCPTCNQDTMQVVRPGKVQCSHCS